MTLWSPDTCDCKIEVDPHPDPAYVYIHRSTVMACPKHAHLAHSQAHADEVLRHNRTKNLALDWISEKLGREIPGHHGNYDRAATTNDPVIVINHGVVGDDLKKLQADVDAHFGAGAVVLAGGG